MTERQLAQQFIKENFNCFNIDCDECMKTNFLHQCLQQTDVKGYCMDILGRDYTEKMVEELKEHCDELELINQKVMEENEVFKDREDGFKKQIIGLCQKYHQVYERFPEMKDSFLQGDRIMQENERLKTDLEYAKVIIKDLLDNSHEYSRQNAEDFIKGDEK